MSKETRAWNKKLRAWQKAQMNPMSRKYNQACSYLFFVFTLCLVVGTILMYIDEDAYWIPFACLLAVGTLPIIGLLAFLPLVRKKAAQIELTKYDFDEPNAEESESYLFESTTVLGVYEAENSPFEELDGAPISCIGENALHEALSPILGENYNTIEDGCFSDLNAELSFCDYTDDLRHTPFEIARELQDNGVLRVTVSEKHALLFEKDGVTFDGVKYPYSEVTALFYTSNPYWQVSLYIEFEFEEDFGVFLRLSGKLLRILRQFEFPVENREELDYILQNQETAFRQILRRGQVKMKKIK